MPPEVIEEKTLEIKTRLADVKTLSFSNLDNKGLDDLRQLLVEGETFCLMGSSGVGKTTLLNNLIGQGTKVAGKDASGNTALHYAVKSGFEDIVRFLIANHANVNASGKEGKTPLDHCNKHDDIIENLILEALKKRRNK